MDALEAVAGHHHQPRRQRMAERGGDRRGGPVAEGPAVGQSQERQLAVVDPRHPHHAVGRGHAAQPRRRRHPRRDPGQRAMRHHRHDLQRAAGEHQRALAVERQRVLDRARHRELLERDAVAADPRQRDRAVEGEDQALAGDAAQRAQPGHRGGRDLGEAGQLEHAQAIAVRDHQVRAEQRRRRRVHGDRAGRGDLERDRVEHGRPPAAQGHQGATVGGRGDDGDAGAHESFAASASSASSSKLIAVARARSASV